MLISLMFSIKKWSIYKNVFIQFSFANVFLPIPLKPAVDKKT